LRIQIKFPISRPQTLIKLWESQAFKYHSEKQGFFIAGLLLSLFIFSNPNLVFAQNQNAPKGNPIFYEAEGFFHSGKTEQARTLFDQFLRKHPFDPLAANALLRLAEIDIQNKSYVSALRFLEIIPADFPDTPLIHKAKFRTAECYFALERYPKAEKIFKDALRKNPDTVKKWQALIYLGRIDEKKFDYQNSLRKLLYVLNKANDISLKQQTTQLIEDMIQKNLSSDNLMNLSRKYKNSYPGDIILLELISKFRQERNNYKYQIVLEDFLLRFPNHSNIGEIRKMLSHTKGDLKKKLRLGAVLPLSGKRALVGQQVLQGIQLALNKSSLIDKNLVELIVRDSQSGQPIETLVEDLANDPNMMGIIGPVMSGEVAKIVPIIDKYKIPAFTPTASSSGLADLSPFIFRNSLTREIQAKFLAQYAVNELNLQRIVILHPNEPYGEDLKTFFSDEVKALGGEVVSTMSYNRSQTDFKEQILKIGGIPDDKLKKLVTSHIKSGTEPPPLNDKGHFSKPVVERGFFGNDSIEGLKVSLEFNYDAIFIPGFYDKVSLIVPQLIFYNIEKPALLGASGWNSPELVKNARRYLKSAIFVDGFFINSEHSRTKEFVNNFRSSFGEDPTILSAQAFDVATIYLKLIREGAKNRLKIKKRLHAVQSFPGVSGATTILPSGDVEKTLSKLKVQKGAIVELN
jgi:branched-chain amino acid transport system substrate-binding protein